MPARSAARTGWTLRSMPRRGSGSKGRDAAGRDTLAAPVRRWRGRGAAARARRGEGLRNLLFLDAMPKPRLAGLLAGADIGLHLLAPVPAFAEAVAPNKVADYLAAGLPIVTNTPGAVARLIEGGDAASPCRRATARRSARPSRRLPRTCRGGAQRVRRHGASRRHGWAGGARRALRQDRRGHRRMNGAPLVLMLSAAHPPDDIRIVRKEGAAWPRLAGPCGTFAPTRAGRCPARWTGSRS
jgi:hypothetical protein